MATSNYEQGYDDDRFENPVGPNLHCAICLCVFKDPVMCRNNEHCFCRPCITRHLKRFKTCPTCMDELTPRTLSPVSRLFKQCWSELNIRCNFYNRGCRELVQLGDLEIHLVNCGFAPVKCSNEGCHVEINKRDRQYHENEACRFRDSKCRECGNAKHEIADIKKKLMAEMEERLEQMSTQLGDHEIKRGMMATRQKPTTASKPTRQIEEIKHQIKELQQDMAALTRLPQQVEAMKREITRLQQQFANIPKLAQEVSQINTMKKQMKEIKSQRATLSRQVTHTAEIAERRQKSLKPCVVVAGGTNTTFEELNSAEVYDTSKASWTPLQPMNACRSCASSFLFQSQMVVAGGWGKHDRPDTMESVQVISALNFNPWVPFPAKLPAKLSGHSSAVHKERLLIIGGHDGKNSYNTIQEVLLTSPYTTRVLARMPQARFRHGALLVGDNIFIIGGVTSLRNRDSISSVIQYDICKNKCNPMPALPYAVNSIATARLGDNVVVVGGVDKNDKALNTAIMYNFKTGNSHMLPNMKYRRNGCVVVNVGNSIIVAGGKDEKEKPLNTVEKFNFESYSWVDLPPMNEARWYATAVVC